MNLYKFTYKYLLVFLAMMVGFTSCVLDDIEMPEEPSSPDITIDEYNLSFNINLQSLQSRDGSLLGNNFEDYEDYIDPAQTYILFFTVNDNLIKLFSEKDLSLLPVRGIEDESVKQWVVRIPISKMKDGEAFAAQLRKDPFKIAVLANWGKQPPEIKQATYSEESNSYTSYGDNIDVLHHQTGTEDPYVDSPSEDDDNSSGTPKEDTYGFLYKEFKSSGKYMGKYSNWVEFNDSNKFDTKKSARNWIRNHWKPDLKYNRTVASDNEGGNYQYQRFTDLWLLWNFGGADEIEKGSDANSSNALKYHSFASEWEERNGRRLRGWITRTDDKTDDDNLGANYNPEDQIPSLNVPLESDEKEINYLAFKTVEGANAVINEVEKTGKYYYGVNLPVIEPQGNNVGDYKRMDPDKNAGYFRFMARASGTLFITVKNVGDADKSRMARITAQVGFTGTKVDFEIPYNDGSVQTIEKKIPITGNEDWVYIFNRGTDNNKFAKHAVEIYQIEFIQDEYLYNTDRSGVVPSTEQPIAMYGIQRFEKLEQHWEKGTSFDLSGTSVDSDSNGDATKLYAYKNVMLLRSVAKIELQIPSSLKPDFVYLRSVNRKARWEPVDISTNTSEIWKDYTANSMSHPSACEWFTIKEQQNFFNNSTADASTQLENYKKKLAWYYGAWSKDNGHTVNGQDIDNSKNLDFPRLMNAVIERSDFVEFIKAPSVDQLYDRYVLYVGEKYVDDPNDVGNKTDKNKGMEASRPKICHIEFRLGDEATIQHTNLDDNNCVRIYMIEGGIKSNSRIPDFQKNEETGEYNDWEHTYEQDVEKLKGHWPIMRNHVYSFKVIDVNNLMPLVDLKVLPWKMVEDQNNYDW